MTKAHNILACILLRKSHTKESAILFLRELVNNLPYFLNKGNTCIHDIIDRRNQNQTKPSLKYHLGSVT